MDNNTRNNAADARATRWGARVVALVEVTLAFALMHLAFRAFKSFTAWGQAEVQAGFNFSTGLVMMVVALALIAAHRQRPADFGLTPHPFFRNLNTAFFALLVLLGTGVLLLVCGMPFECPQVTPTGALTSLFLNAVATCLMLWGLLRSSRILDRTPRPLSLFPLIAIPLLPIILAIAQQRPADHQLLTILWVLLASALGEEVFFRGYVQSRLNQAFGRPWRFLGIDFGFGLIGAALPFGFIHVLNGVDYFGGTYNFMWWHGLATASCLFYGFLREKTGSVLAPAIVHGFVNLLVRLPELLANP